jgi:Fe-S cluster biogenesis protein NfuA
LIEITLDNVVRLSLKGSCNGCPSSQVTLTSTIEEAVYAAAPETAGIEVDGAAAKPVELTQSRSCGVA